MKNSAQKGDRGDSRLSPDFCKNKKNPIETKTRQMKRKVYNQL